MEEPALISSLSFSRETILPQNEPQLAVVFFPPEAVDFYAIGEKREEFLTDKVKEKLRLSQINFGKLARRGLDLATNLTGKKFSYKTNQADEIIALNLDTRLLGLSIPVRNK